LPAAIPAGVAAAGAFASGPGKQSLTQSPG